MCDNALGLWGTVADPVLIFFKVNRVAPVFWGFIKKDKACGQVCSLWECSKSLYLSLHLLSAHTNTYVVLTLWFMLACAFLTTCSCIFIYSLITFWNSWNFFPASRKYTVYHTDPEQQTFCSVKEGIRCNSPSKWIKKGVYYLPSGALQSVIS